MKALPRKAQMCGVVVVHAFHSSIREAEAGGTGVQDHLQLYWGVPGQPGLHESQWEIFYITYFTSV